MQRTHKRIYVKCHGYAILTVINPKCIIRIFIPSHTAILKYKHISIFRNHVFLRWLQTMLWALIPFNEWQVNRAVGASGCWPVIKYYPGICMYGLEKMKIFIRTASYLGHFLVMVLPRSSDLKSGYFFHVRYRQNIK